MSSTMSQRHEPAPKTWWPQKPPKLSKFNSIATAIGFKSKKLPSLAIEHPPPVIVTSGLRPTYGNRPPSKSVSSTLSRVDSIGPRTPVDTPRDEPNRHSLLTLSDTDPFAGRGIVTPITPGSRLSNYSNASEPSSKRPDPPPPYRGSYASSSSQPYTSDTSPTVYSPVSPLSDFSHSRKLKSKRSTGSMHKPSSIEAAWDSLVVPIVPLPGVLSKSDSSVTLTEKFYPNKTTSLIQSESTGAPRPALRPRGMTEGSIQRSTNFAPPPRSDSKVPPRPSTSSHASPRVIVRQPSSSRLVQPPCAPPTQQLPAPPTLEPPKDSQSKQSGKRLVRSSAGSSSSGLSFASSVSSTRELRIPSPTFSPRRRERPPTTQPYPLSEVPKPPPTKPLAIVKSTSSSPHPPRTLKKAVSHQTLGKRSAQPSNSIPPSPNTTPEKGPRKQRSFHHHIPLPPIPLPLRHANSFGSQSSIPPLPDSAALPPDHRRAPPTNLPPTRKRLWSGSSTRRPATSNGIVSEDDSQSIFSLRSEFESHFTRTTTSGRQQSSFWDEPIPDQPASPSASTSEYMPQQIMSAAEIAQVVEESNYRPRTRGMSIMSTSTMTSAITSEEGNIAPSLASLAFSSVSAYDLPRPQTAPMRTPTVSSIQPARLSIGSIASPPSIAPNSSSPPNPYAAAAPIHYGGLPPPPRPRGKLHTFAPAARTSSSFDEDRDRAYGSDHSTFVYPSSSHDQKPTPLAPPPIRRPARPKVSMEKVILRQSIMKKPSFLDIDDDTDRETDVESPTIRRIPAITTSSFLDLARESFDSIRTVD
ncbi:hypothetical protein BDN72DRAFT_953784 [Pluteus cervinus]|uniref:Uncharacterized protein n=1 Tax=Pluteus cervinus TaxID=181527 RepID=A0ACD3BH35_9AGAR|nr:hypothetical protein BDN72DRAFT_953784 [Pluteus cervinus]